MCFCFIGPTDPVTGNGGLSLSCVQREHISRVSSPLASLGGELEVGRNEPDTQRVGGTRSFLISNQAEGQ